MSRNLSNFNLFTSKDYLVFIRAQLWLFVQFLSNLTQSSRCRVSALRLFGADIGSGVKIKGRSRVHFPWNLVVGENCWIGEAVWIINHERITIGSNVCISQRCILSSGGHDYRSSYLKYTHKPIKILDGAWLCLDAKVLPGVTIGRCSVVSAGEIVRKSIPDYSMFIDGQLRSIDPPK